MTLLSPVSKPKLAVSMAKPKPPKVLSDAALELIAGRFKVLSEGLRLKLIIQLETGEKNVTELVRATGATQANVSRHLQTLTEAGIVSRRKEGQKAFYRVADDSVFEMCDHVCGSLRKRFEAQADAAKSLS
jgi:ArsR family transcriptional regulator